MDFVLLWCVAMACESGMLQVDVLRDFGRTYTQEQCVAEANSRLKAEPHKLFVCQELMTPSAQREEHERALAALDHIRAGKFDQVGKPPAVNRIYIGPRTLSN